MTNFHLLFNKLRGVILVLLLTACQQAPPVSHVEAWIPLFNGTDLQEWTPKFRGLPLAENYKNTFLVEDSLLKVRYTEYDSFRTEFGHLFYRRPFSHYRLKASYRFVNEQVPGGPGWAYRNNGLMLHCQAPETMGLEQDFPISLEMQLLGGNGRDDRPTANLCTPGTSVTLGDSLFTPHCINSSSPTFHGDQWVDVEVLVLGDSLIRHLVEGAVVLEYSKPIIDGADISGTTLTFEMGTPLKEGYIAIQAESHDIDFRSIELLNLCGCMDVRAKNYRSYYIKPDNTQCIY